MSTILVVEDERSLAEGLRFNLEAEGYGVEVVETGEGSSVRVRPFADFSRLEFVRVVDYGVSGLVGGGSSSAPAAPPAGVRIR